MKKMMMKKMMMKKTTAAALFAVLVAVPLSAASSADDNPVKERQKLMRSLGKAMQNTGKMMQGAIAYDAAAVREAMTTAQQVATAFPTLFPTGSDMDNALIEFGEESDAKPEIWGQMDDFKKKAEALKLAAATAEPLAADKAGFADGFKAVSKACKECHSTYKKPDE